MGLSSNVIWHQTKHEGIKAILSSMKFKCSYSLETIRYGKEEEIVAFPMISFCGIPIADTHEYLGKYGRYTIGLKRTWGEKKGLSYVWYREDKASTLFYQMKAFKRILDKDVMKLSTEDQLIWNLIAHTKNFQGKLERKKQKFDPYRFYDENEIRYVPLYQSLVSNKIKPILSMNEYEDYKKVYGNSLIDGFDLPFTIHDINYMLTSRQTKHTHTKTLFPEGSDFGKINFIKYDEVRQDIIGIDHCKDWNLKKDDEENFDG